MKQELEKLYNILTVFLGEAKNGFDENTYQYQFPCPHCVEKYGWQEARKYNLEVSISRGVYQCWRCSSEGDELMHGSIKKLIKVFGNNKLLEEYMTVMRSIRESELYKLDFKDNKIDTSIIEKEELKLPSSYKLFKKGEKNNWGAFKYLRDRGIGWDIIEKYRIGYTEKENENKKGSFRIIIPSYNAIGELNYWVGRDYLPPMRNEYSKALNGAMHTYSRLKYDNPKVEKKNIIFNEEKIQWDADITLVEGPFDHIVVPNSVPLLGKALNKEYKLYWDLIEKANGNVNIWLDSDAKDTALQVYSLLNHGRLNGKIRMIESSLAKDPSEIYQDYGYKGIAKCLQNTKQIEEYKLVL